MSCKQEPCCPLVSPSPSPPPVGSKWGQQEVIKSPFGSAGSLQTCHVYPAAPAQACQGTVAIGGGGHLCAMRVGALFLVYLRAQHCGGPKQASPSPWVP